MRREREGRGSGGGRRGKTRAGVKMERDCKEERERGMATKRYNDGRYETGKEVNTAWLFENLHN